ncbi:unnamed protein product [Pleuronectes platessa]|uniref:Uncharacterized protein n=1 Tax=Pleuronectes platessa TaxID=8262 RepID=A0A9N7VVD2_PLEPL|nr:unnamed protein product [Pleuronectes platessa]
MSHPSTKFRGNLLTLQASKTDSLYQVNTVGHVGVLCGHDEDECHPLEPGVELSCCEAPAQPSSLLISSGRGQGVRQGRAAARRHRGAQGPTRRQACRPRCCVISSQAAAGAAADTMRLKESTGCVVGSEVESLMERKLLFDSSSSVGPDDFGWKSVQCVVATASSALPRPPATFACGCRISTFCTGHRHDDLGLACCHLSSGQNHDYYGIGIDAGDQWGGPLRGPHQRSASHCPYEAALPRVTCCPLAARYLSHPDSTFLFLSEPLLFHLPTFPSPLLSLAPVLRSFRQSTLPRPRRAESTPSPHPCPGHRGNYLPKLGWELDSLPPRISADRLGRSTSFH